MPIADHIKKDSPTNNFATLANPIQHDQTGTAASIGNLKWLQPSNSFNHVDMPNAIANLSAGNGKKWYWEVVIFNYTDSNQRMASSIGVILQNNITKGNIMYSTDFFSGTAYAWGNDTNNTNFTSSTGLYQRNGATLNTASSADISYLRHGVVVGVLLDLESSSKTVTLYENGSEVPNRGGINTKITFTATAAASPHFFPIFGCGTSGGTQTHFVNFGQDSSFGGIKTDSNNQTDTNGIGDFYYSVPSGALALCTANLLDFTPTVDDDNPEDYFKTIKWNGSDVTAGSTGDTSGTALPVGFNPDFIWIKSRNQAYHNTLYDSVRGFASDKSLISDQSYAEATTSTGYGHLELDGNNNVLVKNGSQSSNLWTAESGKTYCAWCWKAGGAPTEDNTATSGAMTSTDANNSSVSLNGVLQSNYTPSGSPTIYPKRMSINTEAGFSIVNYSGNSTANATVPHGLNSKVEFSIVKGLNTAQAWSIYHKDSSGGLIFSAATAGTGYDHSASGDNLVSFSSGWDGVNGGYNYIMYCWHSVEGFSAFGSYIGNLSTDGPFVYTGFKPAFVLLKHTTGANQHWWLYDSTRDPINYVGRNLYPNLTSTEGSYSEALDFLSNGFKIKTNSNVFNNTQTCIYAAFAEQPTKFANAR